MKLECESSHPTIDKGMTFSTAKTLNKASFDAAIDTAEREAIDKAFDNTKFSLAGYKCKPDCERRFAVNIGPLSSLIGRWISNANVESREAESHTDVLSEAAGYLTGVSFPVYSPPKFPSGKAQGQMSTARAVTSNSIYWLALSLTPGLGPTRGRKLVERFTGIQDVFHASLTELEAENLQAHSAQHIALGKSLELATDEIAKATAAGIQIICRDDESWPARLSEIYDPPLVLYVRGNIEALSRPGLAIVGTRHPTPYGIGMAERLSCDLASRGLAIFSGMARGVDTAGHRGAIKGKGRTAAVFGTGVDIIYPRENKKIAEGILECGGALVSEFPLESFAAPQNFPIRNRIISGLALGVLVVEAGEYSGTRITARCALEQSREIFAVPGNVTSRNSWGPNTLIKQGAKLTATWEDIWEELPADVKHQLESEWAPQASEQEPTSSLFGNELSPAEKKLLSILRQDESTHIDVIMEKLEGQISSSEVFTALFELEMSGKVKQMAGKNYVKAF